MTNWSHDQASGLRRLFRQAPPEVLCVVPCGAGAFTWTARQIVQRGRAGRRVLALDESATSGSLADSLGIQGCHDLLRAVRGEVELAQCLGEICPEVFLAPVAQLLGALEGERILLQRAAERLRALQPVTDEWIVLARAAGMQALSPLAMAAPRLLLVVDAHPKAMTEAYATLKRCAAGADTLSVGLALAGPVTPETRGLLNNLQGAVLRQLGVVMQPVRSLGEAFGLQAEPGARELSELFIDRLLRLSREAVAARAWRGLMA